MTLETAKPLAELAEEAARIFRDRHDAEPACVAAAPGRVNLIGEHTDYNDGFVLPMAIQRSTVVVAAPRESGPETASVTSVAMGQSIDLPLTPDGGELPAWARYARGVLDAYREAGVVAPRMNVLIDSNVPLGGGLSSSAALEVALALAIESLAGASLDGVRRALLCQRAEHVGAGMPCGIMDQFSSALCRADHLMLLDCRSQTAEMAPLADPSMTVLVINSNVKHELTGGEYAQRREQCAAAARALGAAALRDATLADVEAAGDRLGELPRRRARHVVTENDRTVRAARAIASSDWATVGELMYASHASMRDDFEITIPEIDALVEFAREIGPGGGVIGSRMTGGGFGGCTVTLVESDAAEQTAGAIARRYQERTGVRPTCFTTRPADGGRLLPIP